jgi:hypothetical protein
VFSFDGSGNVTGTFNNMTATRTVRVPSFVGSASGTYTVNSNGTGTINFTSPEAVRFLSIDSTATSAPRMELINLHLVH